MDLAYIWRSLFVTVIATLLLSVLSVLGLFRLPNYVLMDKSFAWFPPKVKTPDILMVELNHSRSTSSELKRLIEQINSHNHKGLYWVNGSDQDQHSWLINDQNSPGIPRDLIFTSYTPPSIKASLSKAGLGAVSLLASHYRVWVPNTSHQLAAFQFELAGLNQNKSRILDYTMGDNFIPRVSGEQLLNDEVPPTFLEGKWVLLGTKLTSGSPGFSVPFNDSQGISLLEIQAYILHNAVNDRFISEAGFGFLLLGCFVIFLISFATLQWFDLLPASLLALVLMLLLAIANYVTINQFSIILPTSQWCLLQVASLLAVYQLKRRKEEDTLKRLVAEVNARLSERIQPRNFNDTDNPWDNIINFVNQHLNIDRSIFLERVPKDHRVAEIAALNCDINDIGERRRDYERAPYSDALSIGGPIQPRKDYFKNSTQQEVEYLMPLVFSGEVMGFWAATLSPDKNWNQLAFENNVRNFSDQIAELLYHRQYWSKEQARKQRFLFKLFALETGGKLHTKINQSIQLLEQRLDTLENVFNKLSTAAILYDVFGQIIHTNTMMERLAKQSAQPVYQQTATELLSNVAGISLDDARKKVRYVVLKHQTVTLDASDFTARGHYILHIRPLTSETLADSVGVTPFQVLGILFEFLDVSDIQERVNFRRELVEEYIHGVRNDIATIGLAAGRINVPNEEKISRLAIAIQERTASIAKRTAGIENELEKYLGLSEGSYLPVNLSHLLNSVVDDFKESELEKPVEIEVQTPHLSSLVLCDPDILTGTLKLALKLLVEDANMESIINVFVHEDSENKDMLVNLTNDGQGMASKQLNNAMTTTQSYVDESDPLIVQLAVLLEQLKLSGVDVKVRSSIGSGYTIDLSLRLYKFIS